MSLFTPCTMNRIYTHTHTLTFPACLCLAPSYSQGSHLRKTDWDIPALLLSSWQGARAHTQREKPWRAPVQGTVVVKCTQTHTLWAATHRPMRRLGKTTACVCVFWVQREVVMTGIRKKRTRPPPLCIMSDHIGECSAETSKYSQTSSLCRFEYFSLLKGRDRVD